MQTRGKFFFFFKPIMILHCLFQPIWFGVKGQVNCSSSNGNLKIHKNDYCTDLGKSCRIFPQIEIALNDKCPTSLTLTPDEAFHFIQETGSLLMTEGFGVIIPADINKPQNKLSAFFPNSPETTPHCRPKFIVHEEYGGIFMGNFSG